MPYTVAVTWTAKEGEEDAVAAALERFSHNLLAVSVLVTRCRIDHVQSKIHRPMDRLDALLQRHRTIGQIADPEKGGVEAGCT